MEIKAFCSDWHGEKSHLLAAFKIICCSRECEKSKAVFFLYAGHFRISFYFNMALIVSIFGAKL
jgi:hypothetical protein